MKMVVTLRNGVQIKMDVEKFSTGAAPLDAQLQKLTWTLSEEGAHNGTEINWIDLSEIVAVHAERGPGDSTEGGADR